MIQILYTAHTEHTKEWLFYVCGLAKFFIYNYFGLRRCKSSSGICYVYITITRSSRRSRVSAANVVE